MDAFEALGASILNTLKSKNTEPAEKITILNMVDNNLVQLQTVQSLFQDYPQIITAIPGFLANDLNKSLQNIYTKYCQLLNTQQRLLERNKPFQTISDTVTFVIRDHQLIRDQFNSLFDDGTDAGEITPEQFRLSHAVIMGYLILSRTLADWFSFFYGTMAGQPIEAHRDPAYRLQEITDSTQQVASFVQDVLQRGKAATIIDLVRRVRQTGDVAVYSDAAPLSSYANAATYPGISNYVQILSPFQAILWVRELFVQVDRYFYKRNVAMREWLQTKAAILQLDMAQIDSNSPEYQRLLKILQNYSAIIADLDKKIAKYENG